VWFPKSLTFRLTWFYGLSTVILLVVILGLLYQVLAESLVKENYTQIHQKFNIIDNIILNSAHDFRELEEEVVYEGTGEVKVRIIDGHNHVVIVSPDLDKRLPYRVFPNPNAKNITIIKTKVNHKSYLLASKSLLLDSGELWTVQVAADIESDELFNYRFLQNLIVSVFFGSITAMLLGYLITRRGLNPLKEITQAIERISVTKLDGRLDTHQWPKELKTLALSFNEMLTRLDESIQRLSQFSANLAHELRTPLHNLIGQTDVTLAQARTSEEYQRVLISNLEEYERLKSILESLLFLARADNSQMALHKTLLDGREVLEGILCYQSIIAEEQSIFLCCRGGGVVLADLELFRRAVNNLISNALRHSLHSEKIIISIHEDIHETLITVQDFGQGISSEHLDYLGQQFYRADAKDTVAGNGLGLAIVKSIMNLHEGNIKIESQLGVGTTVRLSFPK